MSHLFKKLTLLLVVGCLPWYMHAQITSNAFFSEQTVYPNGNNDPVFYYADINGAQLSMTSVTSSTFTWYAYNGASGTFDNVVQTDAGTTMSTLLTIAENGYRVEVNSGAGAVDYYCWNFVPVIQLDSIGVPSETCNNVRLTAYSKSKTLVYYNHKDDGSAINVDYGYLWTSVPTGPMDQEQVDSKLIAAPTDDTEYSVEHGAKFAPSLTPGVASYEYESIAVEASFEYETEGTADNEAKEGSAPLVVRFSDSSLGKVSDWEWTFGEAGKDFVPDPIFTFQKAGEYPVVLIVKNLDSECESETAPEIFTANELVVKVPNAFTPFSSPGQNDEFKVLYRSVNKFSMVIYNRWGRKVYSGSNPAQGWDGRIGSQKAEPGVYFYTIEAQGFNEGENLKLEGAVHLVVN